MHALVFLLTAILGLASTAPVRAASEPFTLVKPPTDCSDPEDHFGRTLARVGRYLVVGAPGEVCGFAFAFDAKTGGLVHTLRSPLDRENNLFGAALAPAGRDILVGAPRENRAYLFDGKTGALGQTYVGPSDDTRAFGSALAALGRLVVVGAPSSDPAAGGAVYLFDAGSGAGVSGIGAPFLPSFGTSLAAAGKWLAIGSPGDFAGAPGQVFLVDPASGAIVRTLGAPAPTNGDQFGRALAALGDDLLVGAPGNAGAVYRFDGRDGKLLRTFTDPDPSGGNRFGVAIAAGPGRVVVGAPDHDLADGDEGAVYVFDARTGALQASFFGASALDQSGTSVAVVGDGIAIGTPADVGSVRVIPRVK